MSTPLDSKAEQHGTDGELEQLDCRDAVELLPWLLNGSLEAAERSAVRAHLAACDACRGELELTAAAREVFSQHVPSRALVEWALDLGIGELDRERIERHLERCPSCRDEVELVRSDRVVDFEADRPARAMAPPRWRRLAIAAGLVAAAGSGLIWSVARHGLDRSSVGPARDAAAPTVVVEESEPIHDVDTRGLFASDFESGTTGWTSVKDS